MQTTTDSNLDTKLSAIDKALAAAKARKAIKDSNDDAPRAEASAPERPQPKPKKETQPDFAKQQKKEALAAARAAAKAARDADRQKRRDSKASETKGPVHMKKVASAAARLPSLTQTAQTLFNEITTNLSAEQITTLALHLQHFNRVKATERALEQKLDVGTQVRITGGDPRFVGKTGVIDRAQRIRCYVNVPGVRRPVYLFTSDVEVVTTQADLPVAV